MTVTCHVYKRFFIFLFYNKCILCWIVGVFITGKWVIKDKHLVFSVSRRMVCKYRKHVEILLPWQQMRYVRTWKVFNKNYGKTKTYFDIFLRERLRSEVKGEIACARHLQTHSTWPFEWLVESTAAQMLAVNPLGPTSPSLHQHVHAHRLGVEEKRGGW